MENIELITASLNAFTEALKHLDKGMRGRCEKLLDEVVAELKLLNEIEKHGATTRYSHDRYMRVGSDFVHASQAAKSMVNSLNCLRAFFGFRILKVSEFGY